MLPRSDTLFHFTRSLDYLKSILERGFYPRYCLEDTEILEGNYAAYPMVCFCDIPISRVAEHTAFYGSYGVGLTREWALRNKLCPVVYTPASGPVVELAKFLIQVEIQPKNQAQRKIDDALLVHFNRFIPLIKPLVGRMVVGRKVLQRAFYQENEWRYLPEDLEMIVGKSKFTKQRAQYNRKMETQPLLFGPTDIRYIFVKTDAELPLVYDFLLAQLGKYPLNDIKTLITRITSLETLSRDV